MEDSFYNETIQKFEENTTVYPSDILDECPKFRILVVGQTGSGKSTLCSKVFRVDKEDGKVGGPVNFGISKHTRGTEFHQVWNEITFPGKNEEIVLHDSGGFEAGDVNGLEEIRKFIKDRLTKTTLADQLHCIWYCIPLIGHRHIQSAEKMFFNDFDLGKIPVVAVFTHFDALEEQFYVKLAKQHQRQHPRTPLPQDIIRQANAYAVKEYDEVHRRNLEKILGSHSEVGIQRVSMPPDDEAGADDDPTDPEGVNDLIGTTKDMLTQKGLRRLWVSAQQQSAELKRKESVEIAMQHFEGVTISNSIPLVPFLGGGIFRSAFNNIFSDVSKQYGLIDPFRVLSEKATRKRVFEACLKLSAGGRIAVKTASFFNILGSMTAPLITAALLKMIVGIVIIHEEIFWKQRDQKGLRLTAQVIEASCARFAQGKRRQKAAAHIDGSIDISNYGRKQYCTDVVTSALEMDAK